jgi:hypothetical protein
MLGLSADDMRMFDAEGEAFARLVGPGSCTSTARPTKPPLSASAA